MDDDNEFTLLNILKNAGGLEDENNKTSTENKDNIEDEFKLNLPKYMSMTKIKDAFLELYNRHSEIKEETLEFDRDTLHEFYINHYKQYIEKDETIFEHYSDEKFKNMILYLFKSPDIVKEDVWMYMSMILLINFISLLVGEDKLEDYGHIIQKLSGSNFSLDQLSSLPTFFKNITGAITTLANLDPNSEDGSRLNNLMESFGNLPELDNTLVPYIRLFLPQTIVPDTVLETIVNVLLANLKNRSSGNENINDDELLENYLGVNQDKTPEDVYKELLQKYKNE